MISRSLSRSIVDDPTRSLNVMRKGSPNVSGGNILSIGSPYNGGYIGGYISHTANGVPTHVLIISPLAAQSPAMQQVVATAGVSVSTFDGALNHAETLADSIPQPQALWVQENLNNIAYGGYSDWYVPSRNELDILFWNLKPSTLSNNNTGWFPNEHSIPARPDTSRSETIPGQTDVLIFRMPDGAEALNQNSYWSSSRSSTGDYTYSQNLNVNFVAMRQSLNTSLTQILYVRPMRREALP